MSDQDPKKPDAKHHNIPKEEPAKERGVTNDVDEAVDETFPASDPPSFMPGITGDPEEDDKK